MKKKTFIRPVKKYPLQKETKRRNLMQNITMVIVLIVALVILLLGATWVFNLNDKEDTIREKHILNIYGGIE